MITSPLMVYHQHTLYVESTYTRHFVDVIGQSWIFFFLYNQCISPLLFCDFVFLTCMIQTDMIMFVSDLTIYIYIYSYICIDSIINKTGHRRITVILLKLAQNTYNSNIFVKMYFNTNISVILDVVKPYYSTYHVLSNLIEI